MARSRHSRIVFSLVLRFILIVPCCLAGWWLLMPAYAWLLGFVVGAVLKHIAGVPIESFTVANTGLTNPNGLFNTGTQLTFVLNNVSRTLPELGSVVTNTAPFVALVLATPGLRWRRRIKIIPLGVALLFAAHMGYILMAFLAKADAISMATAEFFITLPFLLWIVLAYGDKLGGFFVPSAGPKPAPDSPRAPAEQSGKET